MVAKGLYRQESTVFLSRLLRFIFLTRMGCALNDAGLIDNCPDAVPLPGGWQYPGVLIFTKGVLICSTPSMECSPMIWYNLGTANTWFMSRVRVSCSVSVSCRCSDQHRKVLAVGHEAKRMLGRTPGDIAPSVHEGRVFADLKPLRK